MIRAVLSMTVACALMISGAGTLKAQTEEILFNDAVQRPFAQPGSIDALREDILQNAGPDGLSALPANADQVLPRISEWRYLVVRNRQGLVSARLIQRFDGASIIAELREWISRLKKDGCSFVSTSEPRFTIHASGIEFHVDFSGKKRACGDGWAADLATIEGKGTGSMTFRIASSNAVPNFRGAIEVQRPDVNIDADATEIIGIDLDSVVGELLKLIIDVSTSPLGMVITPEIGVPAWSLMSELDRAMQETRGRASDASIYMDRFRGRVRPDQYNRALALSQTVVWEYQPTWTMDDGSTRFTGGPLDLSLEIVFNAPIPDDGQVEQTIEGADTTLRRLRSYSDPGSVISAQPGDSWSRLAGRYYGTQFLASALRSSQPSGEAAARILIGQAIVLPPFWRVTLIPGHFVVRPADTMEALCRQREENVTGCVGRIRRLNPRVVPTRMAALSTIVWSESGPPRRARARGSR